jgi:hypothetical protein
LEKENPDVSRTDITNKLRELWKNMDDNDKRSYEKKALEDKLSTMKIEDARLLLLSKKGKDEEVLSKESVPLSGM